ncbi:monovalent cation/H+ antiporter subunit D family protein [Simiduia litorea]|uniref:monovalent cation/H+ antiporter subunit D family protein n=1 Tax=Simiduia litorea TaxID=1435348 RepID=UPI0036F37C19
MSIAAHWPAIQVVMPLLAAPIVMLLRGSILPWLTALATSLMAFAIAISMASTVLEGDVIVYAVGSWSAPIGIELRVDGLSALLLLVVTGASSLTLFAARHSLTEGLAVDRHMLFYAAWLLALAGMLGILVAGDAFNIFVFMEIAALASYVLISAGSDRRALPAVFKYVVMGTIGATFYLIGVGLVYMMTGTLNLADMETRLADVTELKPIIVAAGFITVGLALKAALFPLHAWLPNSYTYAPHIATAFLAACSTKIALYIMLRFDFVVFQGNLIGHDIHFSSFLMPLALIAILVASGVALFETHIKRLLAYSSIAQLAYIWLGASLVSTAGLTASAVHMFNHALAKGALFLAVACLGLRFSSLTLNDLKGAARYMPWTMAAFVIAGMSLVGVPGTAGFISKWYFITAALEQGVQGMFIVAVILVSSLMAVAYLWRVVESAYFGVTEMSPQQAEKISEAPPFLLIVVWVAALANVYFGLNPEVPLALSEQAANTLMEHIR